MVDLGSKGGREGAVYCLPKSLPVTVPSYELNKANFQRDNLALNWQKNLRHISSYKNTNWLKIHEFILVLGVKCQNQNGIRPVHSDIWEQPQYNCQVFLPTDTKAEFIVRSALTITDLCNWFLVQVTPECSVCHR